MLLLRSLGPLAESLIPRPSAPAPAIRSVGLTKRYRASIPEKSNERSRPRRPTRHFAFSLPATRDTVGFTIRRSREEIIERARDVNPPFKWQMRRDDCCLHATSVLCGQHCYANRARQACAPFGGPPYAGRDKRRKASRKTQPWTEATLLTPRHRPALCTNGWFSPSARQGLSRRLRLEVHATRGQLTYVSGFV
jgi:hypothetical protein